jgi:hypothetical protein
MNLDQASKIAAVAQSFVTAAGVIVAGGWVLFTFSDLGVSRKSRAEINQIEQKLEYEAWTLKQAMVSVDFKWDVFDMTGDGKRLISLRAVARNDGKRAFEIDDNTLRIAPLDATDSRPTSFIDIKSQLLGDDGNLTHMPVRIFPSGQARTLAFLVPPLTPGNYLIQLQIIYRDMRFEHDDVVPSPEQFQVLEQTVVNVSDGRERPGATAIKTPPP